MANEYVFLDEWDVDAPQEAVFEALADARTYPEWWKPVYIEVEGDQAPAEGVTTKQHFKGKLPYMLKTTSKITVFDPPIHFQIEVVGDLTGTGK
jgi:Polyketide cyclase / dehydrase and lipid transport